MTDQQVLTELRAWQQRMQRKPSLLNRFTRQVQARLNALLPEKLHRALTAAIQKMVEGVLFGSQHTTRQPVQEGTLAEREAVAHALTRAGNNVTHAARELGISRMTLYRLMDKHRIGAEA